MQHPQSTDSPSGWHLAIPVDRALRALLAVSLALAVMSAALYALWYWTSLRMPVELVRVFDLDGEQNIPTLYSVFLLGAGAFLCGVIARFHDREDIRGSRYWDGLTFIFALLAIDEYVQIHERTVEPIRELLSIEGGILWFAWVIPAAILLLVFLAVYLRFLLLLPNRTRRQLIVAGLVYVCGALGMELVGAVQASTHGIDSFGYILAMHVEEVLEMTGASLFIAALLNHLAEVWPYGWMARLTARRSAGPHDDASLLAQSRPAVGPSRASR